ncbi:MAG TPA: hypothetical protein VGE35_04060 [Candidatus Paceibacterota bacterium]
MHTPNGNAHLENGLSGAGYVTFAFDGVPMSFHEKSIEAVKGAATRFAPFLRIAHGRIIGLNWQFYADADKDARTLMTYVLWAAGVLTTNQFGSFIIRIRTGGRYDYCPRVGLTSLYFASDRKEEALQYAEVMEKPLMAEERASAIEMEGPAVQDIWTSNSPLLEVAQMIREPDYLVIRREIV